MPTYDISVTVPDAVRPGGRAARCASPASGSGRSSASRPRAGRAAPRSLGCRLEARATARSRSAPTPSSGSARCRRWRSKYLSSTRAGAGSALEPGQGLPLANARPTVELTEAFDLFDARTRRSLQEVYGGVRRRASPAAVKGSTSCWPTHRDCSARLDRVGRELSRPAHPPRPLRVRGRAHRLRARRRTSRARPARRGRRTPPLGALDAARGELADSISELPSTEEAGRRALRAARPALRRRRGLPARRPPRPGVLKPASQPAARRAARRASRCCAGRPASPPRSPMRSPRSDRLARDPATPATLAKLRLAVRSLRPTLAFVAPSQTVCNYAALAGRNFSSDALGGRRVGHLAAHDADPGS